MLSELASHNDDLKRLLDKGYALAIDSNYLVVRDIPYLDDLGALRAGAIVTKLVFPVDKVRVTQEDHQIFFAGSPPHNLDGDPIPNLGGGAVHLALSDKCKDVVVQRSFSNKPKETGAYQDFFEKIETYVAQISGPAMQRYDATPYTFRAVEEEGEQPSNSIFKIRDTLTSRAEISDLSAKFANDHVAVIGLGGTGSYVLDLLVKTPVPTIHGFDPDLFYVHNAFRSPGAIRNEEFGTSKAEVYTARYATLRNGLTLTKKFVDESCLEDLAGVTFAFVCVDKGSSRAGIFSLLLSMGIPFIDVGMGLGRLKGPLTGMLRVTHYSRERGEEVRKMRLADEADDPEDIYRVNIQIGELNSLNACLAVIKFKQLRGFYVDAESPFHVLFDISDLKIVGRNDVT